jgi:acylphosphatase
MDALLKATVTGQVQMVGFRAFTQREAYRLGLRGYVRNTPEGGLEVVAEGPQARLEALLGKLQAGPPAAQVDSVSVTWHPASGQFAGFRVRY